MCVICSPEETGGVRFKSLRYVILASSFNRANKAVIRNFEAGRGGDGSTLGRYREVDSDTDCGIRSFAKIKQVPI
jgi:hypothetical protein